MGPEITISEFGDISFIRSAVDELENAKTYVGIPEEDTKRKGVMGPVPDPEKQFDRNKGHIGPLQKSTEITNAALLYIHTNGSIKWNIPPRPVIEPSIAANQQQIEEMLHKVAELQLDKKKGEATRQLKLTGTFAANAAKAWFTDPRNNWPQNQPRTIAHKISRLKSKKKKRAIMDLVIYIKARQEQRGEKLMPRYGKFPELDAVNTPLIDTGQLRRAITHVEKL